MTGAPIPRGADAIVIVEDTSGFEDKNEVKIFTESFSGKNIRYKGEEISNGDILQSLAMALAVRMKMIAADDALVEKMVMELVLKALNAAKKASITEVSKGNA